MAISADPDQLASSEANWSGSTLFAKTVYPGSAELGLKTADCVVKSVDPDQMLHFAVSYPRLHCLLCLKT